MALLNYNSRLLVFTDQQAVQNPQQRIPDFAQSITNLSCSNPQSQVLTIIPSTSQQIFSGVVSTGLNGSVSVTVSLSTLESGVYRFTAANPSIFKTRRSVTIDDSSITVAINNNATATFSGVTFTAAQAGDILYVPGAITGDSFVSPFNQKNQGYWQVLAVPTSTTVVCKRAYNQSFQGVNETVTVPTGGLIVFSNAGVQIGNRMEISGAFSSVDFGVYTVSQVTDTWVEVASASPLPLETASPTSSQMTFFSAVKSFIMLQVDQNCVVQLNGDASSVNRVTPVYTNNGNVGIFTKLGFTYSMTIVNSSVTDSLNLIVFTAE